jgi:hypothetical protein
MKGALYLLSYIAVFGLLLLPHFSMRKLLKFAEIYRAAASAETHRWAADIVNKAFQQVMGRAPSPAERQIVMAVANHETGYGRGWGKGKSTGGQGSHNWGAVQTRSKTAPGFTHGDSSAEGKYKVRFKSYPDDVAGAADVVKQLFKSNRKQHLPNPQHAQRAQGAGVVPGEGRGTLIEKAAQQGDTLAFSRAMWYTGYFEGFNSDFTKNIKSHADSMQSKVNKIAAALGERPAWSIRSVHYLPDTSDQAILQKVTQVNPKAAGTGGTAVPPPQQPGTMVAQQTQSPAQQEADQLLSMLFA